jgi:hypothetical protein
MDTIAIKNGKIEVTKPVEPTKFDPVDVANFLDAAKKKKATITAEVDKEIAYWQKLYTEAEKAGLYVKPKELTDEEKQLIGI